MYSAFLFTGIIIGKLGILIEEVTGLSSSG